jgi:hypothetical protein
MALVASAASRKKSEWKIRYIPKRKSEWHYIIWMDDDESRATIGDLVRWTAEDRKVDDKDLIAMVGCDDPRQGLMIEDRALPMTDFVVQHHVNNNYIVVVHAVDPQTSNCSVQ